MNQETAVLIGKGAFVLLDVDIDVHVVLAQKTNMWKKAKQKSPSNQPQCHGSQLKVMTCL